MADQAQLEILLSDSREWNSWRLENFGVKIDLRGADLQKQTLFHRDLVEADLTEANLSHATLRGSDLTQAILVRTNLSNADLVGVPMSEADLSRANLEDARLSKAELWEANFTGANLAFTYLDDAQLGNAKLDSVTAHMAKFFGANLAGAKLRQADLRCAHLMRANLIESDLRSADLRGADLHNAILVKTRLQRAKLSGASVYGASVWDVHLSGSSQSNLVISPQRGASITVDNLEVAQFIYLVMNNRKIQSVIETIGNKGVLILGRFTERKDVLEAIKQKLRERGYLPMVFDFTKPANKDFTETVQILAGMSRFIIADITAPKSVPLEAQALIPNYMTPFVPIIQKGEEPFSMFQDLWIKYRQWVLKPRAYKDINELIDNFDAAVIRPANKRLIALRRRKIEALIAKDMSEYE